MSRAFNLMMFLAWVVSVLLLLSLCAPQPAAADIPPQANQYKRLLTSTAHMQLGLNAPVATLAAQVHQESRWRANAVSSAGAQGLAQFMPATAKWMPEIAPALGAPQPFNPAWSLRAMVAFDVWLLERTPALTRCENWAFTLAAYNGGLGWVNRDRALAFSKGLDKQVYFESVETLNAGRAAHHKVENQQYVRLILTQHEALYARAGWGNGVCEHRWAA